MCRSQKKDLQSQLMLSEARTLQVQDELERLRDELGHVREAQEQARSTQDELEDECSQVLGVGAIPDIPGKGSSVVVDGCRQGHKEIIKWFSPDTWVRMYLDDLGEIRTHL